MEPTQPNSGAPGAQAAAAIAPDAATAEILRKHAAGEPLTPQESGKMGWWKKTLNKFSGTSGPAAQPAGSATPARKPAVMGAVASGEAPADRLEPPEIDDSVCQRTTAAILGRANTAVVGKIEREVSATVDALGLGGAEREKMLARFRSAAALPNPDQKLIVELSPDVCRELGINPRQFALFTVAGVLGLHAVNLWQCIQELKDLRRTARPSTPEPAVTPASASKPALAAANEKN